MNKNGINRGCPFLMTLEIRTNHDIFQFTVALWELDSTSYFMMHSGGGIKYVHYGHGYICFYLLCVSSTDVWHLTDIILTKHNGWVYLLKRDLQPFSCYVVGEKLANVQCRIIRFFISGSWWSERKVPV